MDRMEKNQELKEKLINNQNSMMFCPKFRPFSLGSIWSFKI